MTKNPTFRSRGKLGKPSIGKDSCSIRLTIPESEDFTYEMALAFLRKARLALTVRDDGNPEQASLPGVEYEQLNAEADCQEFTTTETAFKVTLNFGNGLDPHKLVDFREKDVYVIAEKIGESKPKEDETGAA